MEDLKKFYAKFNSEELHLIEEQSREFHVLYGMMECLKVAETSLGKINKTTIELRKIVNMQIEKLGSIKFPQSMLNKLYDGI
jgi:hypothetical protein